jgi:hypothetical protein
MKLKMTMLLTIVLLDDEIMFGAGVGFIRFVDFTTCDRHLTL